MNFFRTLTAIVLTASLVQVFPVSALEANQTVKEQTSVLAQANEPDSGICGDDATWEYDGNGTLTIKGTGEIKYYGNMDNVEYDDSYQKYSSSITKVVISDGITIIGVNAFYGFSKLTSVSIPDSVVCIGGSAFGYCLALTSVEIPDGVMNIESSAFLDCTALESVTLPDSLMNVESSAFKNTALLNNQTDALKYVGNWLLSCDDKEITSAEIKKGTKGISSSAFYQCTRLTSVSIPEGVEYIYGSAFYYCNHLPEISLPDSLKYLGDSFSGCDALKKEVTDGVTYVDDWAISLTASGTNGILKYKEGTKGIVGGSLNLPRATGKYAKAALNYTGAITIIDIPESVQTINYGAFYNRKDLQHIIIRNPNCKLDESDDYSRTFCNDWYSDTEYYFTGTIYGEEGSTAQAYAEKYNITFKPLSEAPDTDIQAETVPVPVSSGSKGDINGDGSVNAQDAGLILIYAADVGSGKFTGTIEEYMKSKQSS